MTFLYMVRLKLTDFIGAYCLGRDGGLLISYRIEQALDQGECVEVDFQGVIQLTRDFIKYSIGRLYGIFPNKTIDGNVIVKNLNGEWSCYYVEEVKNAKRYYGVVSWVYLLGFSAISFSSCAIQCSV